MTTARICIATPCYGSHGGKVFFQYAGLLHTLSDAFDALCGPEGWSKGSVTFEPGPYPIDAVDARAELFDRFLHHPAEYSHLLSWDEDTVASPERTVQCLRAMLRSEKDWVGVPVPMKGIDWTAVAARARDLLRTAYAPTSDDLAHELEAAAVHYSPDFREPEHWALPGPEHQDGLSADKDGFIECTRLHLAFTLLSRHCVQRMTDAYPELRYWPPGLKVGQGRPALPLMYLKNHPSGAVELVREDYAIADRWRQIGGRIFLYVGPGAPMDHIGTHVFKGSPFRMPAIVRSTPPTRPDEGR